MLTLMIPPELVTGMAYGGQLPNVQEAVEFIDKMSGAVIRQSSIISSGKDDSIH